MFQVSSCEATFQDNVAPTDTIIISSNQTKKDLNLETFYILYKNKPQIQAKKTNTDCRVLPPCEDPCVVL